MSRPPSSPILRLLVLPLALLPAPLGAQTIRSVSDAEPRLVPGGDAVAGDALRPSTTDLSRQFFGGESAHGGAPSVFG
ncbi:MAG: hypothetical protein KJO06_06620 [Gemmatimonadetes bacterium]|nr:hypothetical protein [Gemmatimonadota bacterium]